MRPLAVSATVLLLAGCSLGGGGDDGDEPPAAEHGRPRPAAVSAPAPPTPPARPDASRRYAYVLVPAYGRLRDAFVAWTMPCVYIKRPLLCIERNRAVAEAARAVLARLEAAPPSLALADRLLRRGLRDLAAASDRQRLLLERGDETGYLNSFSAFFRGAVPDVTNGIGEVREVVRGADLPLLEYTPRVSRAERGESRSP
jgi:hypothetical protein